MNCWCGNKKLEFFSTDYCRCEKCETLVSSSGLNPENAVVNDDSIDFYGKKYWDTHQKNVLELPDIYTRSVKDLTERCLHWLQTILKYKLPPADILELGCAHGGFISILNKAGYEATGLELSPTIVEYAKKTFDIPVLCGPIESQKIKPDSLDVIVLMDVIEHLVDPVSTIQHCIRLLKKDGFLVIQCPRYPDKMSYEEMVETNNPFLKLLEPDEHLYLFSQSSIRKFFEKLGINELKFEQAIFGQHDMFFVAGLNPLNSHTQDEVDKTLLGTSNGRIIKALLDMADQRNGLATHLAAVESDQKNRLELIKKLNNQLSEVETDRENRLELIEKLNDQLTEVEEDRSERLRLLVKVTQQLQTVEKNYNELLNKFPIKILRKLKLLR
jgi:SAM-dependent methyltransferase